MFCKLVSSSPGAGRGSDLFYSCPGVLSGSVLPLHSVGCQPQGRGLGPHRGKALRDRLRPRAAGVLIGL